MKSKNWFVNNLYWIGTGMLFALIFTIIYAITSPGANLSYIFLWFLIAGFLFGFAYKFAPHWMTLTFIILEGLCILINTAGSYNLEGILFIVYIIGGTIYYFKDKYKK